MHQPAASHCSLSALFLPKNVPMLITMLCVGPDKDKTKPSHYKTRVAAVCCTSHFPKTVVCFHLKSNLYKHSFSLRLNLPLYSRPIYLAKGIDTKRWRLHQQVRRYSLGLPPLKEVVAL